eukprot:SAG11_NODE_2425_length_3378_cov_2.513118_1_plen_202_part_00
MFAPSPSARRKVRERLNRVRLYDFARECTVHIAGGKKQAFVSKGGGDEDAGDEEPYEFDMDEHVLSFELAIEAMQRKFTALQVRDCFLQTLACIPLLNSTAVPVSPRGIYACVCGACTLRVQTGRAVPALIETISVLAYEGSAAIPLNQLGTVSVRDPQTLTVQMYDPSVRLGSCPQSAPSACQTCADVLWEALCTACRVC